MINLTVVWPKVGVGRTLSATDAKNPTALTLTFILAIGILVPGALGGDDPTHAIGSGPEDWWTAYPDQHSKAGSAVDHPSWALDPLEEKPVIVLIHLTNCHACASQEVDIREVISDEVAYVDVLAEDDLEKTWTALQVYDPSGDPGLVPVTVLLTLAPGADGEAEVAWHSAVGQRGKGWIRSYLNDAIALYEESSEGRDR